MLLEFLSMLFGITLEIDGNFDRLNYETFCLYTQVYNQHFKRKNLKSWWEE